MLRSGEKITGFSFGATPTDQTPSPFIPVTHKTLGEDFDYDSDATVVWLKNLGTATAPAVCKIPDTSINVAQNFNLPFFVEQLKFLIHVYLCQFPSGTKYLMCLKHIICSGPFTNLQWMG